jgi:hypothetical protein
MARIELVAIGFDATGFALWGSGFIAAAPAVVGVSTIARGI